MLPGLRILLAITLLSVSVLIFALGAAAFLRSAHEDVANAPWRPIETPATARVDLAAPTLAMLRVEPEAAAVTSAAKGDAPAQFAAPAETKTPAGPVPTAEASPSRAEPTEPAAAKSPEIPVAPAPASTPPPSQATVAAAEPMRDTTVSPAVAEIPDSKVVVEMKAETNATDGKAAEAGATTDVKAADANTVDAKAASTVEPQPVPTIVAALGSSKVESSQPAIATEPASVMTAPPATSSAAASPAAPIETAAGTDTLKAADKMIDAMPASRIAALGEPGADLGEPLPAKDVKIPNPRVDPAVIEARQKQILAQQQARARALRARRIAAARARAAAQARAAAAAANPFGAPANSTTNNSTTSSPRTN